MNEKIFCPYCQASEENPDGVEMLVDEPQLYKAKNHDVFLARCFCAKCQCSSPIMVASTQNEARAKAIGAALYRCTPILRPLTWRQAVEADSYLEIKGEEFVGMALLQGAFYTDGRIANCDKAVFTTHTEDELTLLGVNYGKAWRCWSRMPTEEERKAAKWRDESMQDIKAEGQAVQIEQPAAAPEQIIENAPAADEEKQKNVQNEIIVSGWIADKLRVTHEIEGQPFYEGTLLVRRLSHTVDELQLLIPGSVFDAAKLDYKNQVRIIGEIRTYQEVIDKANNKSKLRVKVFARKMVQIVPSDDENTVDIVGTLCKPPVFRVSPTGKKICDLMVAVKCGSGRVAYLPCVAWDKTAERVAGYYVGEQVHITGRLQSRNYQKMNESHVYETQTVHELSVFSIYKEFFGGG